MDRTQVHLIFIQTRLKISYCDQNSWYSIPKSITNNSKTVYKRWSSEMKQKHIHPRHASSEAYPCDVNYARNRNQSGSKFYDIYNLKFLSALVSSDC